VSIPFRSGRLSQDYTRTCSARCAYVSIPFRSGRLSQVFVASAGLVVGFPCQSPSDRGVFHSRGRDDTARRHVVVCQSPSDRGVFHRALTLLGCSLFLNRCQSPSDRGVFHRPTSSP